MDHLSQTFGALADPTRRAILTRLALGEATVNDLAAPFQMSLPAISRHLKVLEKAGLITRGRDAQRRPCRLRPEAIHSAALWLEQYHPLQPAHPDSPDQPGQLASLEASTETVQPPSFDRQITVHKPSKTATELSQKLSKEEKRRKKKERKREEKLLRKQQKAKH